MSLRVLFACAAIICLCVALPDRGVAQRIYWSDLQGTIHSANLDGTDKTELSAGYEDPYGIFYDPITRSLFFTDAGVVGTTDTGKIWQIEADGSNPTEVLTGLAEPLGIVAHNGYVYWVDFHLNTVNRAQVGGLTDSDILVNTGPETNPTGLTIDAENEHIYWVEKNSSRIMRADLDGSNPLEILVVDGRLTDIALDSDEQRLYFAQDIPGRISYVTLGGTGLTAVAVTDVNAVAGITLDLDNRRIFWTDPYNASIDRRIRSADMDATDSNVMNLGGSLAAGNDIRMITLDDGLPTANQTEIAEMHFGLSHVYPNPFVSHASLTLTVGSLQHVRVELIDALGRSALVLFDGVVHPDQTVQMGIDASDRPNGLYIVRARGATFTAAQKVVLLR